MCGHNGHSGHAWTLHSEKHKSYSPFKIEWCFFFFFLFFLVICVVSIIMLFNCDSDQQATENIVQNETKPMDEEEIEDTTTPSTTRTVKTTQGVTTVIINTGRETTTARQTTADITTAVSDITTTVSNISTAVSETNTTITDSSTTPLPPSTGGGWLFPGRLEEDLAEKIFKLEKDTDTKCAFLVLYVILSFVGLFLILLLWCLVILLC